MPKIRNLANLFEALGIELSKELIALYYPYATRIKIKKEGDIFIEDPMGHGEWKRKAEKDQFYEWAKRNLPKYTKSPIWKPYRTLGKEKLRDLVREYLSDNDVDICELGAVRINRRQPNPWMTEAEMEKFVGWMREKEVIGKRV